MKHRIVDRIISCILSVVMITSVCVPAPALALMADVEVENHSQGNGETTVSGLEIDGVSAPAAGQELDGDAVVTAAEGDTWNIPVLWVSDDLQLATQAEEGRTYLPALAFYVPEGYALEGDSYAVKLSDSLTRLFGGQEIVSVYNASTGITYILPASIREFFSANRADSAANTAAAQQAAASADANAASAAVGQDVAEPAAAPRSVVDIYCAQTAKDALTDEDLEWLINLIINTLEPQAVEYLLNSFPAFRAGADNGEVGSEIGLYVYWNTGDKDGLSEHESAFRDALAYVQIDARRIGDEYKFCYMIGVNVDDLLQKDSADNPVRNEATGKFTLLRSGDKMLDFENTLVHELLHAVMDDYNRTGATGVVDVNDFVFNEKGEFRTEEIKDRYNKMHLPTWFIEGSATAVENAYQIRGIHFNYLRADSEGNLRNTFEPSLLVENYLNGKGVDEKAYYDLMYCDGGQEDDGTEIKNYASAYAMGYLAVVYLADLASVKNTGQSAIEISNDQIQAVDTNRLRLGFNSILERMHNGETLDQVISDISPVDGSGAKIYKDTNDFQAKFIKGPVVKELPNDQVEYLPKGDEASSSFVCDYLNYLKYVSEQPNRNYNANGSILMPVDVDVKSPLDPTKNTDSDILKIIESNRVVPSTVPDSIALAGGGKSDPYAAVAASADGADVSGV
ncbi:MAG: hypothetical protein IKG21_09400, partial [Atopobiaceae bacterium]|nr:hypothetical protein [Atopobiaceae bacterium]